MVDEAGKVAIDLPETIAALKYVAELYKTMISGTMTWMDVGNNQAYLAGKIALTFNGISIYTTAKNSKDPSVQAIAADTLHQSQPHGFSKRLPITATPLNAMLFKHSKFPNAAKEYLRYMMEAEQYGPWLSECLGYWCNPLKAYSSMKFWDSDPQLKPFKGAMDTPFYEGYKGPGFGRVRFGDRELHYRRQRSLPSPPVLRPADAAKQAARQMQRYYKRRLSAGRSDT